MVDMSNLMLFVEENLLYDLDKCYEKDYYIPNTENDKTREKCLINTPLISPHSTLPEQTSKMLYYSSFCDDFTKLLQKNSGPNPFLNVHNDECNDWEDVQAGRKMSSNNPFVETINKQTECINTLSPEMFIQILKTNEKFQKQILSIFSFLIVRLDSAFVEDNDHSSENELKKSYEERLLHASEFLKNIILKEDISSLLTSKATNCSNNIKIGFQSDQSNGMFMSLFANNNNYVANGKSEINDSNANKAQYKLFEQIDDTNNIVLNSKPQVPYIQSIFTDQDESAIINSSQEKSAMAELKTNTSVFPYQNDFKDSKKNQFNIFDSVLKEEILYNEFNETNPFKILLKLKEYKDLNSAQVEDNKLDFKKYYLSDNTNFGQNDIEMNNTHDYESTKQYNNYISYTPKFKYDSFHSEFLSTGNNNQYKASNMNLGTSLFSENDYFQSFNTYSTPLRDNKIEQLINPTFSLPINNQLMLDEFRFDRTNVMHNSEICSDMSNEGYIKELKVNSSQEPANIPAETLFEDMGKGILSQVNVPNESYINQSFIESIGMLNINQQQQATAVHSNNYEKAITNFDSNFTSFPYREYTNNDERNVNRVIENNIDFQSYNGTFSTNTNTTDINHREQDVENEHDIGNMYLIKALTKEEINIPWYESLVRTDKGLIKLYFRIIEVNRKKFCIFHLENQGWLLVNDFVEEFTNYKTVSEFYKQLHDYPSIANFKEIKILESLTAFCQYDEILLNVLGDKTNNIVNIHLMPLISIIKMLLILRIITHEDINDIREKGTNYQGNELICKAWILIRYYGELKRFIPKTML